jgi:hypothetical protein
MPDTTGRIFEAMGVPPGLIRFCHLGSFEVPFVRIESETDVSQGDLIALAKLGVAELRLSSVGVFDLRLIGDALAAFRTIRLASHIPSPLDKVDRFYVGLTALESAASLERLMVGVDLAEPVDLSRLPRLRTMHCAGEFGLSAARNLEVRDFQIEVDALPSDFRIEAPLERLVVHAGPTVRDLSMLAHPSALRELVVTDAKVFDVGSLGQMRALQRLHFGACRRLTGASTLLQLPHLDLLEILGARDIPDVAVLRDLAVTRFIVEGNYVFDEQFQLDSIRKPGWTFTNYRKPGVRAARSRRSLADEQDDFDPASTFPFEVRPLVEGGYELVFDDWIGLAQQLGRRVGDVGIDTADDLISKLVSELFPDDIVDFNTDDSGVRMELFNLERATEVGRALSRAWSDRSKLRELAADLGT